MAKYERKLGNAKTDSSKYSERSACDSEIIVEKMPNYKKQWEIWWNRKKERKNWEDMDGDQKLFYTV